MAPPMARSGAKYGAGEASKGECALLRFNDEEKEIQIELKDL